MTRFLLFLFFLFLPNTALFSQTCLPGGMIFESQSDIDNFPSEYPDCTEIEGYVQIIGSGITNLDSLSQLRHIGRYFRVQNTRLVNFKGLDSIPIIGEYMEIINNDSLINFKGLDLVWNIGGKIVVDDNDSLENFEGLGSSIGTGGNVEIKNNMSLVNLKGLDNFRLVGFYFQIQMFFFLTI